MEGKQTNPSKDIFSFTEAGISSLTGLETIMSFECQIENSTMRFMGLYEGHGDKGFDASSYVNNAIKELVLEKKAEIKKCSESSDCLSKIFVEGYKKIQSQMKENTDFEDSGSCAINGLIIDKMCHVINIGYSRGIIGKKINEKYTATQMSIDHTASEPEEMTRIKKCGGAVQKYAYDTSFRIYKIGHYKPDIIMSRSLGDNFGHECGISEEPQVKSHKIEDNDEFIVLGSHSIWELMTNEEIVTFISQKIAEKIGMEKIAEEIVKECRERCVNNNINNNIKAIERIKNNSEQDSASKEKCLEMYYEEIEYQCKFDKSYIPSTTDNKTFTGRHNIPDLSCVIYFFK